jgi:predicted phage terminase large subunit-like protein
MNMLESITTDFTALFEKEFSYVEGKKLQVRDYVEYLCHQIINASNLHVVNAPPRCCKSSIGICLAAWTLGHDPTSEVMILAGREDLAEEISRKVRAIVRAPWFSKAFPRTVLSKSKSRKMDFATDAGGGLYAASIHGNFTGRGADLVIVDDPLSVSDATNLEKIQRINEIFDDAVLSRLNNPRTGKVVIIMHRLHEDDLSGHVWKQGGWSRTVLPLIAPRTKTFDLGYRQWTRKKGDILRPEAFSKREIKRLQKRGSFQLLWQQNPLGNSFKTVKRRHFGRFSAVPEMGVILSIDPSLIGVGDCSFNVIQAWCRDGDKYFVIDQWREQCGFLDLRRACLRMIRLHRPVAILVERTGNGAALLDEFRRKRHNVVAIIPNGSKLDRFRQVSRIIRSRKVLLKDDAPWREEFLDEITHFPTGPADDQLDAATQALSWLHEQPGLQKPAEPALCGQPGAPLPSDGRGLVRGPGFVGALKSNYAPNGRFIQPKVWTEYGSLPYRGER